MAQLRTVSMVFAIIASVVALVAGFILFFVIEPPFLASIFLASASIAIGCFILTGIAAYFTPRPGLATSSNRDEVPHLSFHFSLGAGVTPAQGSVKPTVGLTFN